MGIEAGKMTLQTFLTMNPYCYRCRMNDIHAPSTHAVRNLKGVFEPMCEEHYREFCVGFGNMLLMRDLMGPGDIR